MKQAFYHKIYRHLVALYPAQYRDRFGGQMEQNFRDLCAERKRKGRAVDSLALHLLADAAAGAVRENWNYADMMQILHNPKSAAAAAFVMAAPMAFLMPVIVYKIEPFHEWTQSVLTGPDGMTASGLGLAVLGAAMLLLLPALILSAYWLFRADRETLRLRATHLTIMLLALALIVPSWGQLGRELVRCEILEIPNCD